MIQMVLDDLLAYGEQDYSNYYMSRWETLQKSEFLNRLDPSSAWKMTDSETQSWILNNQIGVFPSFHKRSPLWLVTS